MTTGRFVFFLCILMCNIITAQAQDQNLVVRGETALTEGRYSAAFNDLSAALEEARRRGDTARSAAILASLANVYLATGQTNKAEGALNDAVAQARAANAGSILGLALNNLANLRAVQNRSDEARTLYGEARALADRDANPGLAIKAIINTARLEHDSGKPDTAAPLLKDALALLAQVPDPAAKLSALLAIGQLLSTAAAEQNVDGQQFALAFQVLDQARVLAETQGDKRAASYANGYLARLYSQADRSDEARLLTQQAIFLAQQIAAADLLYLWYWQSGRLHRDKGDLDTAIAAYRQAVYSLQQIRNTLLSGRIGGSTFRETVGPLFLELADLLLQRATRLDGTSAESLLVDARATVEQLKTAELQDYFLDDCVAVAQANATGLDRLAANTAVLYPILLPDRIELLLSLPAGIRQFTQAVPAAEITATVRNFRLQLENRISRRYQTYAVQLYDWLIRPLESALAADRIETLVIVPDGPLRTIPIAALYDGKQFLIEKYALATTPGLTLTDASPLRREQPRVLLGGLTDAVQGFPALPAVNEELVEIQDIVGAPNGTLLKNQNFVLGSLEQELSKRPYTIVHIASHGQFESDIRNSFLLTYNEKLNMDQLEEYMQFRRFSEQPVELLTLSACQTAAGDDRAALGLAGIAIKAGARSALGTLWFINDEASSELIAEFYRQLQDPAKTKAEALRQAQLSLLEDRRYRHPGYWSPFLLIGNWL